jgi:hypothetical protein
MVTRWEPGIVSKRVSVQLICVGYAGSNHLRLWKKEVKCDDACPLCEDSEREPRNGPPHGHHYGLGTLAVWQAFQLAHVKG